MTFTRILRANPSGQSKVVRESCMRVMQASRSPPTSISRAPYVFEHIFSKIHISPNISPIRLHRIHLLPQSPVATLLAHSSQPLFSPATKKKPPSQDVPPQRNLHLHPIRHPRASQHHPRRHIRETRQRLGPARHGPHRQEAGAAPRVSFLQHNRLRDDLGMLVGIRLDVSSLVSAHFLPFFFLEEFEWVFFPVWLTR